MTAVIRKLLVKHEQSLQLCSQLSAINRKYENIHLTNIEKSVSPVRSYVYRICEQPPVSKRLSSLRDENEACD
jgi:hypothetical protein